MLRATTARTPCPHRGAGWHPERCDGDATGCRYADALLPELARAADALLVALAGIEVALTAWGDPFALPTSPTALEHDTVILAAATALRARSSAYRARVGTDPAYWPRVHALDAAAYCLEQYHAARRYRSMSAFDHRVIASRLKDVYAVTVDLPGDAGETQRRALLAAGLAPALVDATVAAVLA